VRKSVGINGKIGKKRSTKEFDFLENVLELEQDKEGWPKLIGHCIVPATWIPLNSKLTIYDVFLGQQIGIKVSSFKKSKRGPRGRRSRKQKIYGARVMTDDFEIGKLQFFHANIFGPLQEKNFIIISGTIYKLP